MVMSREGPAGDRARGNIGIDPLRDLRDRVENSVTAQPSPTDRQRNIFNLLQSGELTQAEAIGESAGVMAGEVVEDVASAIGAIPGIESDTPEAIVRSIVSAAAEFGQGLERGSGAPGGTAATTAGATGLAALALRFPALAAFLGANVGSATRSQLNRLRADALTASEFRREISRLVEAVERSSQPVPVQVVRELETEEPTETREFNPEIFDTREEMQR